MQNVAEINQALKTTHIIHTIDIVNMKSTIYYSSSSDTTIW